jgi:hypothetical protein
LTKKLGLATFCAIFLPTHLVTLLLTDISSEIQLIRSSGFADNDPDD